MNTTSTLSDKQTLRQDLEACRRKTLTLFTDVNESLFNQQIHPEFSPVGWHLAHIGYTENLWLLEKLAGFPAQFPQYKKLLSADGLPKTQRNQIPPFPQVCELLNQIRNQVLDYLEIAAFTSEEQRIWHFILQHESQHSETITLLLLNHPDLQFFSSSELLISDIPNTQEMIKIPAGEFRMGNEAINALDNERFSHSVYLDTYWIDRYPVTCQQYQKFIQAGGYQTAKHWSEAGWEWREQNSICQPLYWQENTPYHPVYGVSWYEAQAYANFVGKSLPTEAQWEKAATWDQQLQTSRRYPWGNTFPTANHCNHHHNLKQTTAVNTYSQGQSAYGVYDLLGNVWEWTDSLFLGYPGFKYFPYPGYSQAYFDRQHYVLKGGSWATYPWAMRCSFRNWYYPQVREILAGFRCVKNET